MALNLRVAEAPLRLVLIKTCPGREADVAQQLRRAIPAAAPSLARHHLMLSFGEYDLLLLVEEPAVHTLHTSGTLHYILGAREVMCYGIESADVRERAPNMQRLGPGPIYGVSFIATPGFFSYRDNQKPEHRFLEWWFDRPQESVRAHTLLFGTLGNPDFVGITSGQTLQEVYDSMAALVGAPDNRIERVFSILAVPSTVLERTAAGKFPTYPLSNSPTDVSVELRVSSRPGHTDALRAAARAMIAPTVVHNETVGSAVRTSVITTGAGAEQFSLTYELRHFENVGEFMAQLLQFRATAAELLLGTVTMFHRQVSEVQGTELSKHIADLRARRSIIPQFEITSEEAETIARLPDVGPLTVRALNAFGDMLQNDLLRDDLIDMSAYFTSLRRQALETRSGDVQDLADLGEMLPPAHHGIDQRTIGAHAGVNPVESNVRHLIGGVNKIIQAAEAIPLSIFWQHAESLWPGFIIVGPLRHYTAHYYQVLDLPAARLWCPNRWTMLIHESVHALVESGQGERGMLGIEPTAARTLLASLGDPIKSQFEVWDLVEMMVDLLELNLGPFWQPELQIRADWEYLSRVIDFDSMFDYERRRLVLREFTIWVAARQNVAVGEVPADPPEFEAHYIALKQLYQQWYRATPSEHPWRSVCDLHEQVGQEEIRAAFNAFWPVQQIAARQLVCTGPCISRRRKWWSDLRPAVVGKVREGIAPTAEEIPYPELFVWALREAFPDAEQMSIRERTAAILGLLDCFRTILLRHRDAIAPPAVTDSPASAVQG